MNNYKNVQADVLLSGNKRNTRSGNVTSTFNLDFEHDLVNGFPALTTKKLAFKAVVGELLWFLSGSTHLDDLTHYSELPKDSKTIWTGDAERWGGKGNKDCGELYGRQWRNFNNQGVDQIKDLIDNIKNSPETRYQLVMSYNPVANKQKTTALPACHVMFQTYVEDGKLSLHWVQRSVDVFLGLGFNIASYGLLTHILAKLCGLGVGNLSATLLDTHIYENHIDLCKQQLTRECYDLPTLVLPEFNTLEELLTFTAKDFKLDNYKHHSSIKGELSVG